MAIFHGFRAPKLDAIVLFSALQQLPSFDMGYNGRQSFRQRQATTHWRDEVFYIDVE